MRLKKILIGMGLVLCCVAAQATTPSETDKVLSQMDAASKNFNNATADFIWIQTETLPLPDEMVQRGNSAFKREAGSVEMAAHIKTTDDKPSPKDLVYSGGVLKMYEAKIDQLTTFTAGANKGMYESFLTLGFGGSGKELLKNWEVSYAGQDKVDGFPVTKLVLVSKLASVRENFTQVILYLDVNQGISRKQEFKQKNGSSRTVLYKNIVVNNPKGLPANAFLIKTGSKTKASSVTK